MSLLQQQDTDKIIFKNVPIDDYTIISEVNSKGVRISPMLIPGANIACIHQKSVDKLGEYFPDDVIYSNHPIYFMQTSKNSNFKNIKSFSSNEFKYFPCMEIKKNYINNLHLKTKMFMIEKEEEFNNIIDFNDCDIDCDSLVITDYRHHIHKNNTRFNAKNIIFAAHNEVIEQKANEMINGTKHFVKDISFDSIKNKLGLYYIDDFETIFIKKKNSYTDGIYIIYKDGSWIDTEVNSIRNINPDWNITELFYKDQFIKQIGYQFYRKWDMPF